MSPRLAIAGFELSTWRLVVLAGVTLCWPLVLRRVKGLGYPVRSVALLLVLSLLVGELGGRLFHALIPLLFRVETQGRGLTVIGSMVSVLAFGWFYLARVLKTEPLAFLDAAAFTLPLSTLIGRIGCLLNGCCFGTYAPSWAEGTPLALPASAYDPLTLAGSILKADPAGRFVWNLPILLSLNALGVLFTAETLYRNRERWRLPAGTVIAAALAQETGGRFLLEFLRWDDRVWGSAFNPWQLSVLALFAAFSAALCLRLARRERLA